jgi:putative acetyltransferase
MNTSKTLQSDNTVVFRTIEKADNAIIAEIIREALEEHGENKPGTVYTDPTTDNLYDLFSIQGSIYFIAEYDGKIIGGCGIYPTPGLPKAYAELVKLYLSNEYRGKGIGKALMQKCIDWALENGYTDLYLESIPALNKAVGLYESIGFKKINHRLGDSGHFACNLWMIKKLSNNP